MALAPSMRIQAHSCVPHVTVAESASTSRSCALVSSIWGTATPVQTVQFGSKYGAISLAVVRTAGVAWSYMENKNPVFQFLNKVQGSLPLVGLVARILNPEGGVGSDRIRLEEFCTRVERGSTRETASAFYQFSSRHGKVARPQFVLIWCWAAALGAGLLRSDDLVMGASRLRVSYDIQYEVENFEILMEEALKRRDKSGSPVPDVPIELRAEKALEAICKCCTGKLEIEEEDAPLLSTILKTVFPTADGEQIDYAIRSRILDSNLSSSDSEASSEQGQEEKLQQPESLVSETL